MTRLLEYTHNLKLKSFWIDTICVPTDEQLKTLGIAKLREVYTKASVVLIVDGRLTQTTVNSMLEAKMQFLCCEWFSRLWTLQEGWLASDLRVQFFNTALSVDQLLMTFGIGSIYPGRMGLDDELYKRLRPYFDKSVGAVTLMSLQRAMHGRRVTKPTDEGICIATLLNLDFTLFRTESPTMSEILGRVKIPEGLLWSEAPRLREKGFRWAPSTLLSQTPNSRVLDYQEDVKVLHRCELTRDGLRTWQACWEIDGDLDLSNFDEDIIPIDPTEQRALRISIFNADEKEMMVLRSARGVLSGNTSLAKVFRDVRIIIGSFEKTNGEDVMLAQSILVENVNVVEGIHYGHYVMSLREIKSDLVERYVDDRRIRVEGRFLHRVEWCID